MKFTIGALFAFFVGALFAGGGTYYYMSADTSDGPLEIHAGQKEFINPLLDCSPGIRETSLQIEDLKRAVKKVIRGYEKSGALTAASVYFKDLNSAKWFGINEKERFAGASLLKVPVMIAYLQMSESDPNLLSRRVSFNPGTDGLKGLSQIIEPPKPLVAGRSYEIGDLLARMITQSDNQSAAMLVQAMPNLDVEKLLTEMGAHLEQTDTDIWLTVEEYASIFRVLYNATYLSPRLSNAALQLLADCQFTGGLVAGLGKKMPVAHKFGERELGDVSQFHDCGIVYYPGHPYLACVMTKGHKLAQLIPVVVDISHTLYQAVESEGI